MGYGLLPSPTIGTGNPLSTSSAAGDNDLGRALLQAALMSEARAAAVLSELLGVSAHSILGSTCSTEPPALPASHVSRRRIFSQLARELDRNRALAVTGYQNSGKTVAIAEFASAFPATCLWFSAASNSGNLGDWSAVFHWRLAQWLGITKLDIEGIQSSLRERLAVRPLLIAVDNAQHCSQLSSIAWLKQLADSSDGKLAIILMGNDDPAFLANARAVSIQPWHCPGLSDVEAGELYSALGAVPSAIQQEAISYLVARTDGHAGLLNLHFDEVGKIGSVADCRAFKERRQESLGAGAEPLRQAIIRRFQSALTPNEYEMCRKISIAFGPAPRRLVSAVWNADHDESLFAAAWSDCVVRLFEQSNDNRFSLPDIYQTGFQEFVTAAEAIRWHLAAAKELGAPLNNAFDPEDVVNSVRHRMAGEDAPGALNHSAMYLLMVGGRHRSAIWQFLIQRFDACLAECAFDDEIDAQARMLWHSLRHRTCGRLGMKAEAAESIAELRRTVVAEDITLSVPVAGMAWAQVLSHAAKEGDVAFVLENIAKVGDQNLPEEKLPVPWRMFLALTAHASAGENPAGYLVATLQERLASNTAGSLWAARRGYEFWRAVGTAFYLAASEKCADSKADYRVIVSEMEKAITLACQLGEYQVAGLLAASLIRFMIDVGRDFRVAVSASEMYSPLAQNDDTRVSGHLRMVIGDALRCAGEFGRAAAAYRESLAQWPEESRLERAEATSLLAVTIDRQGESRAAARVMDEALPVALSAKSKSGNALAFNCCVEAAVMLIRAGRHSAAVRRLIRAVRLLEEFKLSQAERVLLAQIAHLASNCARKTEGEVEDLPWSGFTIRLAAHPDGERMKFAAPYLMLGLACQAVGLPHRALQFFDAALELSDSDGRSLVGFFAVLSAIEVRDSTATTFYACLACQEMASISDAGRRKRGIDSMMGQVVASVLSQPSPGVIQVIDKAFEKVEVSLLESKECALLRRSLQAIRESLAGDDDSSIEEVYRELVGDRGVAVARQIAWMWCFRWMWGRAVTARSVFIWVWRVSRLTAMVAGNDEGFKYSFLEQLKQLLGAIRSTEESLLDPVSEVLAGLSAADASDAFAKLLTTFAERAPAIIGTELFVRELGDCIHLGEEVPSAAVDEVTSRLLDIILSPMREEYASRVSADIQLLAESAKSCGTSQEQAWKLVTERLAAILQSIQSATPSATALEAFIEWREEIPPRLTAWSAANYYIYLRHLMGAGSNLESARQIWSALASVHAISVIGNPDLPEAMQLRLEVCHLIGKGHLAFNRLLNAATLFRSQEDMGSPIRLDIRERVVSDLQSSFEECGAVLASFLVTARRLRDAGASAIDSWSCWTEQAGIARFIGSVCLKTLQNRERAEHYLKAAIAGYGEAIQAAQSSDVLVENVKHVAWPASEGIAVCRLLGDEAQEQEFRAALEKVANADEALKWEQQSEPESSRGSRSGNVEEDARSLADHVMQASGLPEDRRMFVEQDARNLLRMEAVKGEFCRHLQPLQNLEHTRSITTIYTKPALYTGSCTLLGHETHVECSDIETVITTFQSLYCASCQHRKPGDEPPVATAGG